MVVDERTAVGADDLVCAACGGRVGEARCRTCLAALRGLREDQSPLPAAWFLAAAAVVLVLLLLLG